MTMTNQLEAARGFGESLGLALCGVNAKQAPRVKTAATQLDARNNPEAVVFERCVIKLAADIMRESGNMDKLAYHMARAIDTAATHRWPEQFSEFADIALHAIGREALRTKQASESTVLTGEEVKCASAKWLLGLVGRGVSLSPEMLKALLGVSALTGGAIGGTAWKLNRDTVEDEADLEAMSAKIDAYDRISNDMEESLKARAGSSW